MEALRPHGLGEVADALVAAGVSDADVGLITLDDLTSIGVARPQAEAALAVLKRLSVASDALTVSANVHVVLAGGPIVKVALDPVQDECAYFRGFDDDFGKLLARDGTPLRQRIEALRAPWCAVREDRGWTFGQGWVKMGRASRGLRGAHEGPELQLRALTFVLGQGF
jgi:hypothetical protein